MDGRMEYTYDEQGKPEHTPANAARGFRLGAMTARRQDHEETSLQAMLTAQLAKVCVMTGWLTEQQVRISMVQWTQEYQTLGAFEAFAQHVERLAKYVELAGPTDTVPETTMSRTETSARLRAFAEQLDAISADSPESNKLALAAGSLTKASGYLSDETLLGFSSAAISAYPARGADGDKQLPYLIRLCADAIEQGASSGVESTLTPSQQMIAGRVFAGAQPHRFSTEVM